MFFKKTKVPVEVSARHCHLSKADLEKLFGQGYELKVKKQLYQPLDFAAEETITIKEGDKEIKDVRIVGPLRNQTQVEISKTDAKQAGLRAGQLISVQIAGERALTFHCVEVRVREDYKLCLHLDTDEGNAAGINKTGEGTLVVTKFKADK
jgi:putative phosphotransacetylase